MPRGGRPDSQVGAVRLLRVLLLVERAARALAAVAVIGHAFVAAAPIRMLLLIERAARTLAAVTVIGHALGGGQLDRHRLGRAGAGDAGRGDGSGGGSGHQDSRESCKRESG